MPAAPTPEQTEQTQNQETEQEAPAAQNDGQILDHNGQPIKDVAAYIAALQESNGRLQSKNAGLSDELGKLRGTVETTEVESLKSSGDVAALEARLNAKIEEERDKRRGLVSQMESRLREAAVTSAIAKSGVQSERVAAMMRSHLLALDGVGFDAETMALNGVERYALEAEELARDLGVGANRQPEPAPVQRTTGSAIVGQPGEAPPAPRRPRSTREAREIAAKKYLGS